MGHKMPFQTHENSVEENLFNHDVIGTTWFCRLFLVLFLQKHKLILYYYI